MSTATLKSCTKCSGAMRLDVGIGGEMPSIYCLICGHRVYRDFKVRPPAVTDYGPNEGARLVDSRRYITPAERAIIAAKKAEGMTHQQIADLLKRPVGTISKIIQSIRQEARNHA